MLPLGDDLILSYLFSLNIPSFLLSPLPPIYNLWPTFPFPPYTCNLLPHIYPFIPLFIIIHLFSSNPFINILPSLLLVILRIPFLLFPFFLTLLTHPPSLPVHALKSSPIIVFTSSSHFSIHSFNSFNFFPISLFIIQYIPTILKLPLPYLILPTILLLFSRSFFCISKSFLMRIILFYAHNHFFYFSPLFSFFLLLALSTRIFLVKSFLYLITFFFPSRFHQYHYVPSSQTLSEIIYY